jgi:hypothetical protein
VKKVFLAAISFLVLGCSVPQQISRYGCGGDLDTLCHAIFGQAEPEQDAEIKLLKQQVAELRKTLEAKLSAISELTSVIYSLQMSAIDNQNEINLEFTNEIIALSSIVDELQQQATSAAAQLAELSSGARVTAIIEPCGHVSGVYNETLLRLSTGVLVAYFEQGSHSFLSTLGPGSYRTTDSKACRFSVNTEGLVCYGLVCL